MCLCFCDIPPSRLRFRCNNSQHCENGIERIHPQHGRWGGSRKRGNEKLMLRRMTKTGGSRDTLRPFEPDDLSFVLVIVASHILRFFQNVAERTNFKQREFGSSSFVTQRNYWLVYSCVRLQHCGLLCLCLSTTATTHLLSISLEPSPSVSRS